mgnify:CR=1 FL=1
MSEQFDGLAVWNHVCKTDPAFTKNFSKGGGFKGTATNAEYLVRKATELWGPFGGKWGIRNVKTSIVEGAPLFVGSAEVCKETLWVTEIVLFHPDGEVPAFGQTFLVSQNKNGLFTDEEAPKKSLTDAMTKALSWLGFAADIHLGLYDDNRYVNDLKNGGLERDDSSPQREVQKPSAPPPSKPREQPPTNRSEPVKTQSKPVVTGQPRRGLICPKCGESQFKDSLLKKGTMLCGSCDATMTCEEYESGKVDTSPEPKKKEVQVPPVKEEVQQAFSSGGGGSDEVPFSRFEYVDLS